MPPSVRVAASLTLSACLMLTAVLCAGCRRETSTATPTRADQASERAKAPVPPDVHFPAGLAGDPVPIPGRAAHQFSGFLAPILGRVDAANDSGWDSEVFAEAATVQLHKLEDLLAEPQKLTQTTWEELLAGACISGLLRPSDLQTVYQDASCHVRRGAPGALPASPDTYGGPGGVASALRELMRPLRDAKDLRVGFKLFRVQQTGDQLETQVFFQASGRGPRGVVQLDANWTVVWQWPEPAFPPKIRSLLARDYTEILPGEAGSLAFTDVTQSVLGATPSFQTQMHRGVDHWRGRLEAAHGVDPIGNQGIALGDVNGDGLDDVFVCQHGGLPNRLYVRQASGTLLDRSSSAGVDWMEVCRSALFVDLDNDGDQDLAMAQDWNLMIMMNDGTGKFSVAMTKSSAANLYSTTAADYDNDGDLDLFFCGRNPDREKTEDEGILGTPIPYHDANNGGPNMLLRNDGEGQFTEVTEEVGLDVNNRRYSYAASWEDYDNDGDMDLYVANDFGRNNLYRNDAAHQGHRTFTDVAAEAGVEDISAGMSATWGDYNNDGWMDMYVSNMFSSAGNRITYQRRFRRERKNDPLSQFRRHARGNTLFSGVDGSRFDDVSLDAGVTMGRWAWGATFCDLNNDGWEDLYVTNGFITTSDTGDL